MRVGLTGGGEFIGAHVLARMVGAGMDVTLVGPDTGRCRYTESLVESGRVRLLRGDPWLGDAGAADPALRAMDAAVFLGPVAVDVSALAHLVRALGQCRHFILASSLEMRADGNAVEHALGALVPVDAATTILRYATVFGPYESDEGTIPRMIHDALAGRPLSFEGDGTEERDYLHVCDAAEAMIAALKVRAQGVYEIGTGIATRTLDVARLIAQIAGGPGRPLARRAGDEGRPMRLVADPARARENLGFIARRPLIDGLKEEIGWIRAELPTVEPVALAATA